MLKKRSLYVIPIQTVFTFLLLAESVIQHCSDGERSRIAAQECDLLPLEVAQGSLNVGDRPLQVSRILVTIENVTQVKVEKSNTYN